MPMNDLTSLRQFLTGNGVFAFFDAPWLPIYIAGSVLLGRALAPIDLIIGSWKGFISARTQYNRFNDILDKMHAEPQRMPLPAPKGNIQVENLIIGAPGSKTPILRGIGFGVPAGAVVGIIGPSASGKSTLARALMGVWAPQHGSVRLDGADLHQWDKELLGPHIGYLPQDIELFEGSISENIARFSTKDQVAAEQQLEYPRRQVVKETSNAYLTADSSVEKIRANRNAVASAEQSSLASQEAFKYGVVNAVDVLTATQNEFKARRDLLKTHYDFITNLFILNRWVGKVSADSVESVNVWLSNNSKTEPAPNRKTK